MAESAAPGPPDAAGMAANRLGALALAVTDRTAEAIDDAVAVPHSDAVALSALEHLLDGPPIERLRQVLGLTHSGTVRLVDRLEQDGLVRRRAGADARSLVVALTPAGRRAATAVTRARAEVLAASLSVLSAVEQATFDALVGRVLVGMMREPGATRWTCRLCDTDACGRYVDCCPIGNAAAEQYADLIAAANAERNRPPSS